MAHLLYRYRIHLFAMFTACVLLIGLAIYLVCNLGGWPQGRYEGFKYTWYASSQYLFGGKQAKIYIQAPDGQVFYLPEITPDDVGNKIGWPEIRLTTSNARGFENGSSYIRFENGSLDHFFLYKSESPEDTIFLLSASEEGPFLPMPETKKELVAIFGKPVDWKRYHPPTSP